MKAPCRSSSSSGVGLAHLRARASRALRGTCLRLSSSLAAVRAASAVASPTVEAAGADRRSTSREAADCLPSDRALPAGSPARASRRRAAVAARPPARRADGQLQRRACRTRPAAACAPALERPPRRREGRRAAAARPSACRRSAVDRRRHAGQARARSPRPRHALPAAGRHRCSQRLEVSASTAALPRCARIACCSAAVRNDRAPPRGRHSPQIAGSQMRRRRWPEPPAAARGVSCAPNEPRQQAWRRGRLRKRSRIRRAEDAVISRSMRRAKSSSAAAQRAGFVAARAMPPPQVLREDRGMSRGVGDDVLGLGHGRDQRSDEGRVDEVAHGADAATSSSDSGDTIAA